MESLRLGVLSLLLGLSLAATQINIKESWDGGFKGEPCVSITKEMHTWKAHLQFSGDVDDVEAWNSDVSKISSREYLLTNNWEDLHVGQQFCFTFIARTHSSQAPNTYIYIEGMDGPQGNLGGGGGGNTGGGNTGGGNTGGSGSSSKKDYGIALTKSILFYDAQRSGHLPSPNPVPWRGDSATGDCIPGGWYDAGDHVKFGLPMASSTHLLAWSLVKFKEGYTAAGQLNQMYDMIKWPLDYFLRGWDNGKQQFIAQVGDGNADHAYWGRPEDMHMNRPCKWINPGTPGSDIVGESVAAMAAGSIAFRSKDAGYADQLLNAAKQMYSFARAHRGVFHGSAPFYGSSGDKDEMCEAGVWMYRATKDQGYLNDAKGEYDSGVGWSLSWDDKRVACQQLLWEETKDGQYKGPVEGFFNSWMPGGGITYTPCGLAWRDKWGSNRYAGNAAFIALVAADSGIQTGKLQKWAAEQINYLLGDNRHDGGCYSYEIGYGSKFPRHPHHRGASMGHQLDGALVGGPDQNDNYNDSQDDYVANEVATDYNSGFHGALAALSKMQGAGSVPATNNKCPCN